jgi:putative transposase
VNGNLRHLWNLMDHGTRFLLAIQVTKRKGGSEARCLLRHSLSRKADKKINLISDGLASYSQAVRALRRERFQIKHSQDRGLIQHNNNNRIERLNGSVRERFKTMRGLDSDESSSDFARGFASYYNYIRPHSALGGRTPAEAAGIGRVQQKNRWLDPIRRAKREAESPGRQSPQSRDTTCP